MLQSAFSKRNGDAGVLIYNAAILKANPAVEITADSMLDAMSVNLNGAILITGGGLAL